MGGTDKSRDQNTYVIDVTHKVLWVWLVNCKMSAAAVRGLSTAAAVAASMRSFPDGVWPTMITPFHSNKEKSIDWEGLDSKGSPMIIF